MTVIKEGCGSTYKVSDFPLQYTHTSDVSYPSQKHLQWGGAYGILLRF